MRCKNISCECPLHGREKSYLMMLLCSAILMAFLVFVIRMIANKHQSEKTQIKTYIKVDTQKCEVVMRNNIKEIICQNE